MEDKLISINLEGTNNWASGLIQDDNAKMLLTYFIGFIEGKNVGKIKSKNGVVELELSHGEYKYKCTIKGLEGYVLDSDMVSDPTYPVG